MLKGFETDRQGHKMNERTIDEQVALFMQGTEFGDQDLRSAMAAELRERLIEAKAEARPLRVYAGFDPRTSDLHLGHTIPMRKLRQFQEAGHQVYFVVGRFTSLIGDPSDKDQVRAQMTLEEANRNAESYAEQSFLILDPDKTEVVYNDAWLSELSFEDVINLARNFTVQQFLSRENFRDRWNDGDPIYLHEFFYSLMQAYDAYHLRTDVQVGGTDQLFNIITAGRKLMEALGAKPNIGLTMGILPGTDGEIRMSKSIGNHIPLLATPEDMFGKVMSVPDKAMPAYFRLVTRWDPAQINSVETQLESGDLHPRDAKKMLAAEIVSVFHGEEAAQTAEQEFEKVFQKGGIPEDLPEASIEAGTPLVELMVKSGLAPSKSQARRLIQQGAVKLEDLPIEDIEATISIDEPVVLKVGKRRFLRLIPD